MTPTSGASSTAKSGISSIERPSTVTPAPITLPWSVAVWKV